MLFFRPTSCSQFDTGSLGGFRRMARQFIVAQSSPADPTEGARWQGAALFNRPVNSSLFSPESKGECRLKARRFRVAQSSPAALTNLSWLGTDLILEPEPHSSAPWLPWRLHW